MTEQTKSGLAVGNIEHDGETFAHGSPVTFAAKVFDWLLAAGAVTTEVAVSAEDAPPDPSDLIIAAIQGLPPEGFGPDQAPLLEAVKAALPEGTKVTKASLAKAWDKMKGA